MIANIAISTTIQNIFQPSLEPYDVNIDNFIPISSIQSRLIEKWTEPKIM
jgi:hypothetical protein